MLSTLVFTGSSLLGPSGFPDARLETLLSLHIGVAAFHFQPVSPGSTPLRSPLSSWSSLSSSVYHSLLSVPMAGLPPVLPLSALGSSPFLSVPRAWLPSYLLPVLSLHSVLPGSASPLSYPRARPLSPLRGSSCAGVLLSVLFLSCLLRPPGVFLGLAWPLSGPFPSAPLPPALLRTLGLSPQPLLVQLLSASCALLSSLLPIPPPPSCLQPSARIVRSALRGRAVGGSVPSYPRATASRATAVY